MTKMTWQPSLLSAAPKARLPGIKKLWKVSSCLKVRAIFLFFFLFFFFLYCHYPPFRPHCSLSYSRLTLCRLVHHRLSDAGQENRLCAADIVRKSRKAEGGPSTEFLSKTISFLVSGMSINKAIAKDLVKAVEVFIQNFFGYIAKFPEVFGAQLSLRVLYIWFRKGF